MFRNNISTIKTLTTFGQGFYVLINLSNLMKHPLQVDDTHAVIQGA